MGDWCAWEHVLHRVLSLTRGKSRFVMRALCGCFEPQVPSPALPLVLFCRRCCVAAKLNLHPSLPYGHFANPERRSTCAVLFFRSVAQRSTCTRSRWAPLLDSHGHWGSCPRRLRSLRSGRLLDATARASSCTAGKPAGRLSVLKQTLRLLMGCAGAGTPRWLGHASRKAGALFD